MDPSDPFAPPICMAPRAEGLEYFVEHCSRLSEPSSESIAALPAAVGGQAVAAAISAALGSALAAADGGGSHPDRGSSSDGGGSGSGGGSGGSGCLALLTNSGSQAGELRLMSAAPGDLVRWVSRHMVHSVYQYQGTPVGSYGCAVMELNFAAAFCCIPELQMAHLAAAPGGCCTSRCRGCSSATLTCLRTPACCTSGAAAGRQSQYCASATRVREHKQKSVQ